MRSAQNSQWNSAYSGAVPVAPGLVAARDPWLRLGSERVLPFPPAGQPGHGKTASIRRQAVRTVDGRAQGGYTEAFELICPACGDHPYLDYSEVSPELQRIRGHYTLDAALTAYDKHLGVAPQPPGNRAENPAAGDAAESAAEEPRAQTASGYHHEALLYSGVAEFVARTTSFVRRAVTANDPILVVVSKPKISMLRQALGADADNVLFADMASVGRNPGRIIATWRSFVQAYAGASQLWGIGEPIYPGRSPAELAEYQLHEALLNVAFESSAPFLLLCPYDIEALASDVIAEACRTHPFARHGEDRHASSTFRPVNLADPFARPLPSRPADAAYLAFQPGGLETAQAFAAEYAQEAGLEQGSATAVICAVREIAANALQHGDGQAEIRVWTDDHSLVCEISDHGHITSPLAGRLPPTSYTGRGAGLWTANQLCDLVEIYSQPESTVIRLHQNL
jgi:anti-sigma regulatory factor (Ser/Thr protein kinase)